MPNYFSGGGIRNSSQGLMNTSLSPVRQDHPVLNKKKLTLGNNRIGSTSLLNTSSLVHYGQYDTQATTIQHRQGSLTGLNFPNTSKAAATITIGGESLARTVLSTERLHMPQSSSAMDNDWQLVLINEKQRMKKKERENKDMINRLSKDLKREQDRNLHEVSMQA